MNWDHGDDDDDDDDVRDDGRDTKRARQSDVVFLEDDDLDESPLQWSCDACTFHNTNTFATHCDMCGTARSKVKVSSHARSATPNTTRSPLLLAQAWLPCNSRPYHTARSSALLAKRAVNCRLGLRSGQPMLRTRCAV
jgi:hypothetical protein